MADVCAATESAINAQDEAMLGSADPAADHQTLWQPVLAAVDRVVADAEATGSQDVVSLAREWRHNVQEHAASGERVVLPFDPMDGPELQLIMLCHASGVAMFGEPPFEPEPGLSPVLGGLAWAAMLSATVGAFWVRSRRRDLVLLRSTLFGLVVGAAVVLLIGVPVMTFMLSTVAEDALGLAFPALHVAAGMLADPTTPITALLLGGLPGALVGAAIGGRKSRRSSSDVDVSRLPT